MATEAQKLLRAKLRQLEVEQDQQRDDLKIMIKSVVQDFQSGDFIRTAVRGLLFDKKLHKDLFETITPVVSSFISNTVMHRTSSMKVRLLAALGQIGFESIKSNYGDTIQKYGRAYFDVFKELFTSKKS
ncbi:MAG: hypothetical protein ACK5IJ_11785 [Mangrovibacterium sp.]